VGGDPERGLRVLRDGVNLIQNARGVLVGLQGPDEILDEPRGRRVAQVVGLQHVPPPHPKRCRPERMLRPVCGFGLRPPLEVAAVGEAGAWGRFGVGEMATFESAAPNARSRNASGWCGVGVLTWQRV
jgi:hypothetical protein